MAPISPPRKLAGSYPDCPPRGLHGICFALLAATCAQAAPITALGKTNSQASALRGGKKPASLLSRRTEDPGFFRNEGVRAGAPREPMGMMGDTTGSAQDSSLGSGSIWTGGDSMSYRFPMLDNLEPIAPMDRLHTALGPNTLEGNWMDAMYVPAYLNPDAFPTVHGKGCKCKMPKKGKDIECKCKESKTKQKDHYTWLKDTPIPGTDKYKLEPADITYRSGNYFEPIPKGGIVAPADVMPPHRYPNQALADRIFPLPASAREDRLPVRYARYIDQVQARSEECDTVSKHCTHKCAPGDKVVAAIGNTRVDAKVLKTFVGEAILIEFSPAEAKGVKDTAKCAVDSACTVFRLCKPEGKPCTQMKDVDSHNWAGRLVRKHVCPKGSKVCGTIQQTIMSNMLEKDGKACKAAPKSIKKPPAR